MSSKVYVGNLSWNTTDDTLREAFAAHGSVLDSIVMRDRDTGRSRGFGFVTLSNSGEAQAAIDNLNDSELDGRKIRINLANARSNVGAEGRGVYAGSEERRYGESGGSGGY